jgi:hypothetical protein
MLQDILQVGKLVTIWKLELDELLGSGLLEVSARSELVCEPEFSEGHDVEEGVLWGG